MSNPESGPDRGDSFDNLIEKLEKEGFKAELTCSGAPVQLEGFLPGGESFYFRSRWSTARLDIGRIGEEIDHAKREKNVVWSKSSEVEGDMFAASCLDPDETEMHFKSLYSDFLKEKEV